MKKSILAASAAIPLALAAFGAPETANAQAAQPATTSGASGSAPATTTAPASGATTNSGTVLPTTDNTTSQTIETRPDVPQSGSGGATQANPAPDDQTPTAPTAQPGGSTTTAQ